ncbi:sensor histidine kinase [Thermoactinospora rubra]|uniref:sensor histidine kinase n=1 Tax=Thermoactinospora rubra TaxID=1088767 RepID=UPI000A1208DA|nr:ATP-binding protein [Thermoactinospora rubra]
MARTWAKTVRARVTLIAAGIAAFVLIPIGIGAVHVTRHVVAGNVWAETRIAAAQVTARVRAGELEGGVLPVSSRADLIQVVTAQRRVVAASHGAERLPPLSDIVPRPDQRIADTTECLSIGCLHVSAIRATPAPDSVVVYAAQHTPPLLTTPIADVVMAVNVVAVVALIAWLMWHGIGRAMRPVRQMRDELDTVNATDLSQRVTQPPGDDEIAQLARSINGTLDRLERSADQQRQFASDASHELRTPIAGLRAQLESAQLYPEDTDLLQLVGSALRDTDRVEAIITDLLLLARIGSRMDVVKETMDLGMLVGKLLSDRDSRVPVSASLADGVLIHGVRFQIERLVGNVLDNAERHARSRIEVTLRLDGDMAELAVENDGPPIPEDFRERIFERFTRLDSARSRDCGGTGLGLAIAREVAEAHHGTLVVDRDARFVLRLRTVTAPPES